MPDHSAENSILDAIAEMPINSSAAELLLCFVSQNYHDISHARPEIDNPLFEVFKEPYGRIAPKCLLDGVKEDE